MRWILAGTLAAAALILTIVAVVKFWNAALRVKREHRRRATIEQLSMALRRGTDDLLRRRIASAEDDARWQEDFELWRRDVAKLLGREISQTARQQFERESPGGPGGACDDTNWARRRAALNAMTERLRAIIHENVR